MSPPGRAPRRAGGGVPADRLVLHGNNKSLEELHAAAPPASPHRRRQLRRAGAPRRPPRRGRSAAKVLIRATPGWRPTPTTSSAPDSSTRSSASGCPLRRRPGGRSRQDSPPSSWSASTCTSAARSSWPTSSTRPSRSSPPTCSRWSARAVDRGGLGVAYVEGEEARRSPSGARHRVRVPGRRPRGAGLRGAGRSIVAQAAVTLYTVGTIKDVPGVRTYVSVDGGMSDNPRPVLYGSGTKPSCRAHPTRSVPGASRSSASTASPATCSSGTHRCRPTSSRRHPRHARDGRLRHSMGSNYNKCSAPPWSSSPTGRPARSFAASRSNDLLRNDLPSEPKAVTFALLPHRSARDDGAMRRGATLGLLAGSRPWCSWRGAAAHRPQRRPPARPPPRRPRAQRPRFVEHDHTSPPRAPRCPTSRRSQCGKAPPTGPSSPSPSMRSDTGAAAAILDRLRANGIEPASAHRVWTQANPALVGGWRRRVTSW